MPREWLLSLMDDAYFFLNQAKSLSDTPTARKAKARYVRSSIMFSWQALEDMIKDVLRQSTSRIAVPNKLSEKLKLALFLSGSGNVFDPSRFHAHYKKRNDIVHVNAGSPAPEVKDAQETFQYCKETIEFLLRGERIWLQIDPI